MSKEITDTERLDWLESKATGYGGWLFRVSDRGVRLHETTRAGNKPTAREAIDAAMKEEGDEALMGNNVGTLAGCLFLVFLILVKVAIFVAVVWIVLHFVFKYW